MADSPCVRASIVQSRPDVLQFVIYVEEQTVLPQAKDRHGGVPQALPDVQQAPAEVSPHYDAARRKLSFAGVVLDSFVRRGHQKKILEAFQEDAEMNGGDWPPMIYDPLPGGCDDPDKRLQNAVYGLNNAIKQHAKIAAAHCWLPFSTNSEEHSIHWEIVRQVHQRNPRLRSSPGSLVCPSATSPGR